MRSSTWTSPRLKKNIEHTRFPVPDDEAHESTDDFPGLVRAADLIGQLADINYLRKQPDADRNRSGVKGQKRTARGIAA